MSQFAVILFALGGVILELFCYFSKKRWIHFLPADICLLGAVAAVLTYLGLFGGNTTQFINVAELLGILIGIADIAFAAGAVCCFVICKFVTWIQKKKKHDSTYN